MRVVATIHKGTLTAALHEVAAGDALKDCLVISNEIVLLRAALDHVVRGDHQVAVPAASRTSSEVVLASPLVIGGTPIADAPETERVVAAIQYAILAPIRYHWLETDATLLV